MLLGAAGAGVYFFMQNINSKRAARKAAKGERGTSNTTGDDFLADTNMAAMNKKSPKTGKKTKSN